MSSKLVNWFGYNFLFALIPLALSAFFRWLGGQQASPETYTPELLFFAIITPATALGDLQRERRAFQGDALIGVAVIALLLSAVAAAALYGAHIYDSVLAGGGNPAFRSNLASVALGLAVIAFLISTSVQVFLAKVTAAATVKDSAAAVQT